MVRQSNWSRNRLFIIFWVFYVSFDRVKYDIFQKNRMEMDFYRGLKPFKHIFEIPY